MPDQTGAADRTGQGGDRAVETEARQRGGLPGRRAETGTPQQARGMALGEAATEGGDRGRRQGRHGWTAIVGIDGT
jgi:hypothetical protein